MCDETLRLKAALRVVTDDLAELLKTEKFPNRGKTKSDDEYYQQWWESHVGAVQSAYAALAGISFQEWMSAHPGLYSPPPGPIEGIA